MLFTQDHHPLWLGDMYRGRSAFLIAGGPSFAALDQLVTENSRLSRKLTETENLLTAARGKIDSLEAALATSESERNRLTTTVDETNERRQTESNTLTMRLEEIMLASDDPAVRELRERDQARVLGEALADAEAMRPLGVSCVLQKPFDAKELFSAVRAALDAR